MINEEDKKQEGDEKNKPPVEPGEAEDDSSDGKPAGEAERGPSGKSPLEESRELVTRIEAGNAKTEELLNRQEKLMAEQKLSGRSGIGQQTKKEDVSDKEYAEQVMAGEHNAKEE